MSIEFRSDELVSQVGSHDLEGHLAVTLEIPKEQIYNKCKLRTKSDEHIAITYPNN